jgi:Mg2+-importing ATPase
MPDRKAAEIVNSYWSVPVATILSELDSGLRGLSSSTIALRLAKAGSNALRRSGKTSAVLSFLTQFRSPLVLILLFAALVSAFIGEGSEALIIGLIVDRRAKRTP